MKIFQLDDKEEEIQKLHDTLVGKFGNLIEAYVIAKDYVSGIETVKGEDFDVYYY